METVLQRYMVEDLDLNEASGWTSKKLEVRSGVPCELDLGSNLRLRIVCVGTLLRELEQYSPGTVLSSSDTGTVQPSHATEPFEGHFKCIVLRYAKFIGVFPLRAGIKFRVQDSVQGLVKLEVVCMSWTLDADSLKSVVTGRSYLQLSCRIIGSGSGEFEEPPISKYLLRRLSNSQRIESFSQQPSVEVVPGGRG